jgi:hypothetical protein
VTVVMAVALSFGPVVTRTHWPISGTRNYDRLKTASPVANANAMVKRAII